MNPRFLRRAFVSFWMGVLLLAASTSGKPPSQRAKQRILTASTVPRVASYTLEAQLHPDEQVVEGKGTLRLRNTSRRPLAELFFHLYLNAFENEETLFLRKEASRSGQRRGKAGSITVHELTSPSWGGKNIWPEGGHTQGDEKDRTDIRVPLPSPLQAGEDLELDFVFTAHLPQVVERTGFERDFFLVAQWFPKLAKLEDNGKFAHFPFHPHGEFYANFGDYDVTLEVPSEFVVGSTGALREVETNKVGRRMYRAHAQAVHDFAWTAWPRFVKESKKISDVEVTLLRPAHTPRIAQKTWATLERGLEHLGAAYGPYPHANLTVVQPPPWAARAGGMEYPQFITTGGSELFSYAGVRDVELLTVHELAHQWFQGVIASNEMEHPFLDEGLTSYAESRYLTEAYGSGSLVDLPFLQVSRTAGSRYSNLRFPGKSSIASAAPEFESFRAIGSLVYARTTLCLETLSHVYGREKVDQALRLYADRFRFRHPRPFDLYQAFEDSIGNEARRVVEIMFEKKGWIDFRLASLETKGTGGRYFSKVQIERRGSLELPTSLTARFENGAERSFEVSGASRLQAVEFAHDQRLSWVELDSHHHLLLDENFENNRAYPPRKSPDRDQQFHSALALFTWALAALSP